MIIPMWNRWDMGFDPFSELRQMERQMNRLFRDIHGRGTDYPALNYWSTENEAQLEVEMPGVSAEDFELSVQDDVVTIAGERKDPFADENATAHRQERAFGTFSRTLQLPFEVEADQVSARYEHGVLRVTLPRRESTKSKRIEIQAA
ncbi:MAG: Hsp20/alpha crystallin family protein [Kiritimatiellia bacterium]|jgi:HSP20 family protein